MPLHPSFSHREYVSDLALWCSPGNLPVSVLPHTHTKLLQLAYCCCFKTAGTRRWHSTSILTARLNGIALPPTPAQAMTAAMAATMVWARSSTYMLRDEFALPRDFPQLVSVIVFSFFPFRFTSRSLLTFFLHISQMASSIGATSFLSSDIVVEAKTLTCEDLFKSVRLRIHCFNFITHRLGPTG